MLIRICRRFNTVLYRIEMDIVNVSAKIRFISDDMIPIPVLPESSRLQSVSRSVKGGEFLFHDMHRLRYIFSLRIEQQVYVIG